jgi:hypothetical protein
VTDDPPDDAVQPETAQYDSLPPDDTEPGGVEPDATEPDSSTDVRAPDSKRTEDLEAQLTRQLRPVRVVPRWVGWVIVSAGVVMLPWIAGLAVTLPTRHETAHYDAAWSGFDVVLCLMLVRTGWLAQQGREHIELSAAVTGTLLAIDAWFDTTTADNHKEFALALTLALCAELPLAVFCLWIAGRVEFRRRERAKTMKRILQQRGLRG